MELTVNAVWPEQNLGTAFCHTVVVRPQADGSFQYVSNRVIPSDENVALSWYTKRTSGGESEGYNLPVDESEKQEAETDVVVAMNRVKDIYHHADIIDVEDHGDGTFTWTVNVVSIYGETDSLIRHQLTVSFRENGGIQYLGNQVLRENGSHSPEYQFRLDA